MPGSSGPSRGTGPCSGARRPGSASSSTTTFGSRPGSRRSATGAGRCSPGSRRIVGGRSLVIPLRSGLADGDYTVLWRVLSDDGHKLSGVIAFGVGAGRAPPQAALSADNGPSVQDVVSRLLFFAGLLTAAGAAFFRFAVGPVPVAADARSVPARLRRRLGRRARCLARDAVRHGDGGGGGDLRASAPSSRPWRRSFRGSNRFRSLPASRCCRCRRSRATRSIPAGRCSSPWSTSCMLPPPRSGSAASLRLGSLLAGSGDRAPMLRRFSNVALVSVGVLAVTGVIRALAELRSLEQVWSTGYGQVLIVKTALLAALVAVGWLNRYRLLPRLSFDDAAAKRRCRVDALRRADRGRRSAHRSQAGPRSCCACGRQQSRRDRRRAAGMSCRPARAAISPLRSRFAPPVRRSSRWIPTVGARTGSR